MNRIHFPHDPPSHPPHYSLQISSAVYCRADRHSSHAFFGPLHYEPNYAYPLLVWLHGGGDSEVQLKRIMPLLSLRNYVAAAPRGTQAINEDDPGESGYRWPQTADHILLAEQRVLDCIEIAAEKFHVAPHRVFLAGLGSGGTMAFRLAMEHPRRFAGVLSVGGAFPRGFAPLRQVEQSRNVPVFLATGRDSRRYSSERVCADLRLLYSAGMCITLRQYPCGDDLTTQMLSDMDRWMMDQICPTTQPAAESVDCQELN